MVFETVGLDEITWGISIERRQKDRATIDRSQRKV
jgi:hypothetical protein